MSVRAAIVGSFLTLAGAAPPSHTSAAVRAEAPTRHAAGESQAPFTEEAQSRGIDYTVTQSGVAGQGLAFADLDGDGDPDVVTLGRGDGMVGLYENDGAGHFLDRSATSGISLMMSSSGVIAGDYDSDGDLDLYISMWGVANRLCRNDGGFAFTDVTLQAGVGDLGNSTGCGWADYDGDARLDLYVANMHGPNRLYRNLDNVSFEEVAGALGVDEAADDTFQAAFFDFDRDGDSDLYVANAHGQYCDSLPYHNRLFENIGGAFLDITESSGTEACVDSMCVGIGDFDGNSFQDLYITNAPLGHALLLNEGDGTFSQSEVEAGVAAGTMGWGSVFFDYDNDGHTDLYVCASPMPNHLFRHEGAWPSADVAAELGVATEGFSYAVAAADIDDDGDLDLLVQNSNEPLRLFINHEGQQRRWAKFDVLGEGVSRYAIGANIHVRTGTTWRLREVIAGCNYKSQNDLIQHIGLDDALTMDAVRVYWPNGPVRTLQNLPTNQTWTLYPPDKLGDGDRDGDHDTDDFVIFAACYDSPVSPGCEMMDFDGDGAITMDDFATFLNAYDGTPADCNDNGTPDMEEILLDPSADQDGDGELDKCACPADLDGSGDVGPFDLAILLGAWGSCSGCPADFNSDNVVNAADLAILLGEWGSCD